MYEAHYGLREKPFGLHPDPEYLYMSPAHDEVFAHLQYAVGDNKGFVVITGEIGSGKTTLINYLLKKIPPDVSVGLISNTSIPPPQFLRAVCQEFDLGAAGMDKTAILDIFNQFLIQQHADGRRVILIVDEAQNLPQRTLEEVRLLSNLEAEKHHLIQIILVGQPELRDKLRTPGMEQLLQRVSVHCHVECLGRSEVRSYVRHRLRVAGCGNPDLFDSAALDVLYEHTKGVPRLINILCDTALLYGYGARRQAIDRELMEEVVEARKGGGLLYAVPAETEPASGADWKGDSIPRELEERLRLIERRLRRMEGQGEWFQDSIQSLRYNDRRLADAFKTLLGQVRQFFKGSAPPRGVVEPEPPRDAPPTGETPILKRVLGGLTKRE